MVINTSKIHRMGVKEKPSEWEGFLDGLIYQEVFKLFSLSKYITLCQIDLLQKPSFSFNLFNSSIPSGHWVFAGHEVKRGLHILRILLRHDSNVGIRSQEIFLI